MPGAGNHPQAPIGHARRDLAAQLNGKRAVTGAPKHQHRRAHVGKRLAEIVDRRLDVAVADTLQKAGRLGLAEQVVAAAARQSVGAGHLLPLAPREPLAAEHAALEEPDHQGPGPRVARWIWVRLAGERRDEDQMLDPCRIPAGEGQRRLSAHGGADQRHRVELQGVQQRAQPFRASPHAGGHGRALGRATESRQVHRHASEILPQVIDHRIPHAGRAQEAVQKHHRRAVARHPRVIGRAVHLDESGPVGRGAYRRRFTGRSQMTPGGNQRSSDRQRRRQHRVAHVESGGNLATGR